MSDERLTWAEGEDEYSKVSAAMFDRILGEMDRRGMTQWLEFVIATAGGGGDEQDTDD